MLKKEITYKNGKANTVKSMIDHLAENGMTPHGAEQMIYVNIPALGDYRSLNDAMNEGKWDEAWNVADMFLRGDFDAAKR